MGTEDFLSECMVLHLYVCMFVCATSHLGRLESNVEKPVLFLPPCGSPRGRTQVSILGGSRLCPLSHLAGPDTITAEGLLCLLGVLQCDVT